MTLSVLQWNVLIYEKKENILALLKQVNADIVCLQELTIGSVFQDNVSVVEYLAAELGLQQFHRVIPNLDRSEGVGDWANGILTKLPIVTTDWKLLRKSGAGGLTYEDQARLYVETTLKAGDRNLTVGTVHISYTKEFIDLPERQVEADALLEIVQTKDTAYILTGDFNSLPHSYLIMNMQKYLTHAGPDFDVKTWTTRPFSYNNHQETELIRRLDYVFVKDIEVVSSEVVQTEYSDHLPILTTFNVG